MFLTFADMEHMDRLPLHPLCEESIEATCRKWVCQNFWR